MNKTCAFLIAAGFNLAGVLWINSGYGFGVLLGMLACYLLPIALAMKWAALPKGGVRLADLPREKGVSVRRLDGSWINYDSNGDPSDDIPKDADRG